MYNVHGEYTIWRVGRTGSRGKVQAGQYYSTTIQLSASLPLLSSVSTYPSQFRPYFTGYLESQNHLLSIQSFLLDNVPSLMGETEPGALRLVLLHQGVAQPLQLPKR